MTSHRKPVAADSESVKAFLKAHPNFLRAHPELVPEKGWRGDESLSLSAFLLIRLRESHAKLKRRFDKLLEIARHNQSTFTASHDIVLQLLSSENLADLSANIARSYALHFDLSARLFELTDRGLLPKPRHALPKPNLEGFVHQHSLGRYLGEVPKEEGEMLLEEGIQSLCVSTLSFMISGEPHRIALVVGSRNSRHFSPEMDVSAIRVIEKVLQYQYPHLVARASAAKKAVAKENPTKKSAARKQAATSKKSSATNTKKTTTKESSTGRKKGAGAPKKKS